MLEAIREALKIREETLTFAGAEVKVRSLTTAADMGSPTKDEDIAWWRMFVRSVYAADGKALFADDDIPELKEGARFALAPLIVAVNRVNGLDADDNAKKLPVQI